MSEFDEGNVRTGFRRSLVNSAALLLYLFGYGLSTISVPIGTTLMIGGVAVIGVSIASSLRDESPLKALTITVKGLLVLAGIAGIIAVVA
ncbi:MAG: hypothetical protein ACMXYM_04010 [Candidatus Woesearchaeota archaeon]